MATVCKEAVPSPEQFPVGLKVLVVDHDISHSRILQQMLSRCMYCVTACYQATVAVDFLRERKAFFDIVLVDVHMPDMDGFKFLELVRSEMDLPVIMMSGDGSTSLVMKGITHGACDYMIKPIRTEELKNIWQHVVRNQRNVGKEYEPSGSLEDYDKHKHGIDEAEYASSVNKRADRASETLENRKDTKEDDTQIQNEPIASKKPRVVWSVDHHQLFVSAVNQLGINEAVPSTILQLMNVPGLTIEEVAQHLQKYRIYLKRSITVAQQRPGLASSLGRFNIQPLSAPIHLNAQAMEAMHARFSNLPNLLQESLPVSKCSSLDQNVAYSQPSMKCPSKLSKQFSQTVTSAGNAHSGLGTQSPENLVNMVACDNVTGLDSQNANWLTSLLLRQQQELQQKQYMPREPSCSINIQPSRLEVPSHSSAMFQAGNSLASLNQNCSLIGTAMVDYSILSPKSNVSPLTSGRIGCGEIKPAGMLSGLSGAGSISPTLLSGSVNAVNGVGMQVQNSASAFGPSGQLPPLVPNTSVLQDSYNATSRQMFDHGKPKSTDLLGKWKSIARRFAADEIGLLISNVNQGKMNGDNNGNLWLHKNSFISWSRSICLHHCYLCIFLVFLYFIYVYGFPSSTTF